MHVLPIVRGQRYEFRRIIANDAREHSCPLNAIRVDPLGSVCAQCVARSGSSYAPRLDPHVNDSLRTQGAASEHAYQLPHFGRLRRALPR